MAEPVFSAAPAVTPQKRPQRDVPCPDCGKPCGLDSQDRVEPHQPVHVRFALDENGNRVATEYPKLGPICAGSGTLHVTRRGKGRFGEDPGEVQ